MLPIPEEMRETVATLDVSQLAGAALRLADRLEWATVGAREAIGEPPSHRRLADYARERLARWS